MLQSRISSSSHFLHATSPTPLIHSFPLSHHDPFNLYCNVANASHPSFFLESGKGNHAVAHYSFFGCDPFLVLSAKGHSYTLQTAHEVTHHWGDPLIALDELAGPVRPPPTPDLPPFLGGAVGVLSYDLARQFEPLPILAEDDLHFPDLCFLFIELLAAVDQHTQTLYVIFNPSFQRFLNLPREQLYHEGQARLAELEAKLFQSHQHPSRYSKPTLPITFHGEQSEAVYAKRVRQCQEFIEAGDIYQANLSHRFTVECSATSQESCHDLGRWFYGQVRQVNPSPFSAILSLETSTLVCNSPERLVRLHGQRVDTRPIAGTRPRGASVQEDRQLIETLLSHPKERAEHLMLVDLARNDLGRVCRFGTVQVEELMAVERYSHVAHLESTVSGLLQAGQGRSDLIRAMFPGGTITGVPKVHCMELIEQLEPVRRGPYTGSIGYLSWTGAMDLNIIIRTLLLTQERGYLQVGAGIVADSSPHREYEETIDKARAFFQAFL